MAKTSRTTKKFFLSRRWRPNLWPFWVLISIEFALTVALLTFVGIAAPNLYRSRLRADGAENGFNSSPAAKLYAAANYRPYKDPIVWSQFATNYDLVIVVLSMFLMLVKSVMYLLHVLPPIISVFVHLPLVVLYTVAVRIQASSDMSDPKRPQPGAPWYITKSCKVAIHQFNVGYCQQAKATFGCTVAILCVFLTYLGFSIFSCFPNAQQKAEYAAKQRRRQEKYGFLDEPEEDEDALNRTTDNVTGYQSQPGTPGLLNPMTPRTFAFNKLSGTKNQPLRITATKNGAKEKSNNRESKTSLFGLRSPGLPRTPGAQQTRFADSTADETKSAAFNVVSVEASGALTPHATSTNSSQPAMYFPPPPKQSSKK